MMLALGLAVLLGGAAAVVTYDIVRAGRFPNTPTTQDDSDPGLIP
jgi:hypothetical protein